MNNLDKYGKALLEGKIPSKINFDIIDINEIIESGLLDIVPGLGEVITIYRGTMSLRDKLFIKKFAKFIQFLRLDILPTDKKLKFKTKFSEDKEYRTRTIETLIDYIDDLKSDKKIEIYSRLFLAYVNGEYSWEYFIDLSDGLNKVNITNLCYIPQIDTTEDKEITQYNETRIMKESDLISAGLAIKMSVWSSDIYPTELGRDLYKYGIQKS